MNEQNDTSSESSANVGKRAGLEERKRLLADAIRSGVVQGGRVESQSDTEAVLVFGQSVNHTTHVLIAIFTCGIWVIPWAVMALTGGEKRTLVTVDEYGNVLVQNLGKR